LFLIKNKPTMVLMGSDESKQKIAEFHHPVPPEIRQAVIDTGGVTDGSVIPLLRGLSALDMRIKLTVEKYRPAYKALEEARRRGGSKRRLIQDINALLKAEKVLKFWLPWLSGDGIISADVVSLIRKGKLSEWLKEWPSKRGRRSELFLALCAEDLAKLFKQFGRREPPWGKIGRAIATGIPEARALGERDYGNWILNLVRRHRLQQTPVKINPLSRRPARRNTKHLRDVRFVRPNLGTLRQQLLKDRQRRRKSRGKL
jgi:hypothetical protein